MTFSCNEDFNVRNTLVFSHRNPEPIWKTSYTVPSHSEEVATLDRFHTLIDDQKEKEIKEIHCIFLDCAFVIIPFTGLHFCS